MSPAVNETVQEINTNNEPKHIIQDIAGSPLGDWNDYDDV